LLVILLQFMLVLLLLLVMLLQGVNTGLLSILGWLLCLLVLHQLLLWWVKMLVMCVLWKLLV
jgi:hypothetical protein